MNTEPSDVNLIERFESFSLGVRIEDEFVVGAHYLPVDAKPCHERSALSFEVRRQLAAYLKNPKHVFSLPLLPTGTLFQRRAWNAISDIPSGSVLTYSEVASKIKSGPRAVGGACGRNPIPLIVPCHRVVSACGIGGFMRAGDAAALHHSLTIKRWLLKHEGIEYAV